VARNQRERIIYATAENAARKGYHATTIADITATARVDSRVFYTHFSDKLDAALAAHQLGAQHAMAVAASAFFGAPAWPERIVQTALAYTQFQAGHPTISHFGLVDVHAIGLPAVERTHSNRAAFAIFLQEGNQHAAEPRSQTAMEAVVAAAFEVVYWLSRDGEGERMTLVAHHIAYVCLAPFLGPSAANELVGAELGAARPNAS
jgi:AcrR family transcriptional regulator